MGAAPRAPSARLRLLGIRHHGPGSSRAVAAALAADPPEMVLLECVADAEPVLALLGHPEMRPPVALLSYVVDQPERALFAPFASFSPEWVAVRWALAHDVPVRCIDLPARAFLVAGADPDGDALADGPERPADPIAALAGAAGYDDAEQWWDDVFEQRVVAAAATTTTMVDPFEAIGEAMAALRAAYEPLGEPASALERRREAHMRTAVRRAAADGVGHLAVVCGAWHVPAVARAFEPGRAAADAALLRGRIGTKPKVALTWVPWTHRRLATGLGYGAGVTAPGWYHHLHEHPGPDSVARWFAAAAQVLRRADVAVSAADVVEAARLANALAAVRNRPMPGLAEVSDAAQAVLGRGLDLPMRVLSSELVVGAQLGAVPACTPMVPLARDLAAEQKRWRLKPAADPAPLELDLRRTPDLGRSHLLHRLAALGVHWGRPAEGRGTTGTFRETWHVRWEPEFEVRLVEASGLGTTIELAAAAALGQQAGTADSPAALSVLLERALLAGLQGAVPGLLAQVRDLAAQSDDVSHLADTVGPLVRTIRYGDVRNTDVDAVRDVVGAVMVRVAAGLAMACTALDDDASAAMAVQIQQVQTALSLLGDEHLLDLWRRGLAEVVERERVHGVLQGLATRLLADAAALDEATIEQRVSRALSPGTAPGEAAGFVEGFVGGSGMVLVHDPVVLGLLDRWLATLAADAFVEVLPLLRRTFGGFEAAERRALGERVRTGAPPIGAGGAAALDPARVEAALATVSLLLGRTR